jgi:hypothetical protein
MQQKIDGGEGLAAMAEFADQAPGEVGEQVVRILRQLAGAHREHELLQRLGTENDEDGPGDELGQAVQALEPYGDLEQPMECPIGALW